MPSVYATITFCEYVRGVSEYAFFGMIKHGHGHRDFINCTKKLTAEVYVPEGFYGRDESGNAYQIGAGDLTHRYDENSGTFIASETAATHALCYDTLWVQVGGDNFGCFAETQNIQYYAEKMDGNALVAFLKAAIGGGRYIWRFVSESNFRFAENFLQWSMGALNETASFLAETLRFNGNRKYIVNRHEVQVPHGNCVRFRIDAVANDYDWEVYDIDLRTSGLISETTEVADSGANQ